MEKKFKVKDFVEKYEAQTNDAEREKFLRTNLKTDSYMEYSEKVIVADNIVRSSSYAINKDETGVLSKTNQISFNSPMRYVLFALTVVNKYTNIEIDFKYAMHQFDLLNKNGLIEIIFTKVGDREIAEFNTVISMVLDDFMKNEYEFRNYIGGILTRLGGFVKQVSPILDNVVDKIDNLTEEDTEKLLKWVERLGKFKK